LSEFDLIRDHFSRLGVGRSDVSIGVGDDCALLRVPSGTELAVSIDTLVSGVHFLADSDPEGLGHKCLAVGLSDLAAMGAEPAWATLALTIPRADEDWLRSFSRGFSELAGKYGVELVGGDTTRGPLSVSVQVHGLVPPNLALRRDGARPGDLICVSGTLGDAGLALRRLSAGDPVSAFLRDRLERPVPRVGLGLALRGIASAVIDLSDGLAADLGHVLEASGAGAQVRLAELPLSADVRDPVSAGGDWELAVASGDDYELCFCIPPNRRPEIRGLQERSGTRIQIVGCIQPEGGLHFVLEDGAKWCPERSGFDHFA
jgi:thiamine-monophosphate kinase